MEPGPKAPWLSFTGSTTGTNPVTNLVIDQEGNLYGTTVNGGPSLEGLVFKLTPGGNGKVTESIVHDFGSGTCCMDGIYPFNGLTIDAGGNLYGAVQGGGSATPPAPVVMFLSAAALSASLRPMPARLPGRKRFCMLFSVRVTERLPWMTTLPWTPTVMFSVRLRQAEPSTSTKPIVPATCLADAALSSRCNRNLKRRT
jgi:uncharacterized repeat protein (TIGR03803 family)